ncbi:MAG: hypothetical protein IBX46_03550 [Desulfuromonadales bacterium]|nr:hypothetical protein [Desulfuromonadales bacterium]
MIAEAIIATGLFVTGTPAFLSRGVSGTAGYVAIESEKSRDNLMKSLVFGQHFQKSVNELQSVFSECSSANWDGYDAYPVRADTYDLTRQFLKALPTYSAPSSISAEADGHLALEWYHSSRWLLSLSISPEGMLYYAALFGTSRHYGSEPFLGNVPQSIMQLINTVATV